MPCRSLEFGVLEFGSRESDTRKNVRTTRGRRRTDRAELPIRLWWWFRSAAAWRAGAQEGPGQGVVASAAGGPTAHKGVKGSVRVEFHGSCSLLLLGSVPFVVAPWPRRVGGQQWQWE